MPVTKIVTEFPRSVKTVENIFIPLKDGTRLAAKMWLPEDSEQKPVPVILEYIPYRKRDGTRTRDQGLHMYFAGHGYACVRLDIRGTGDSEGLIDDEYTVQEQLDGCEAIAWLAKQSWCDGQVAMIGISWGGFNGLQIAARQPPALKTIITVGSTDDRYATDIHWVGGCLSKDNFDWSSTMFAHNDLPPDPAIVGEKWRDMWKARIEHNEPWILTWLKHQRRDAYWKQGSVCEDFSKIKIPVYAVNGWADNYSESVPRLLAALKGPRLGLIGPWAHSYPFDATVAPAIGWLQEAVRWFDHWLKNIDTGIMKEPLYRVWMQDSVPPQTSYRERPGRWVGESQWPSPRIVHEKHYLNFGGHLGRKKTAPKKASICSPLWVGLGAGEVGRYGEDAEWALDQREDDGGSLVFTSQPLTKPFEILGAPQVHLEFSSDKPQALVCVRLNDVAPDGSSTRVTVGLLNLTHRDSHEHAKRPDAGQNLQGRRRSRRHCPCLSQGPPHRRFDFNRLLAHRLALARTCHPHHHRRQKLSGIARAPEERPRMQSSGNLIRPVQAPETPVIYHPSEIHASPQGDPRFAERPDDRGFPALDLEEGNARHRPNPHLGRPRPL